MIHYTCDCCKRALNHEHEMRYVVRMEVYAALDDAEETVDSDRDHLQEIQDFLECLEDDSDELTPGEVYQQMRFDLCAECRKRFLHDPMGRQVATQFNFSKN